SKCAFSTRRSPRATWRRSARISAPPSTRPSTSGSGPRPRSGPRPASMRWCSAPGTSGGRTRPTSGSPRATSRPRPRRSPRRSGGRVEPADVVLRFLESAGRRSEAEFYLEHFRAEAKERFAAIHVSPGVMRHAAEAVAVELRFLAALGLVPVVLLGVVDPAEAPTHAARLAR